jgi:hypothetical protein
MQSNTSHQCISTKFTRYALAYFAVHSGPESEATIGHGAARDPKSTLLLLFSFFLAALGAAADVDGWYVGGTTSLFTFLGCSGSGPSDDSALPSSKNANFSPRFPPWSRPEGSGALSRGGASVRGVCVGEETALSRL